ncbi:MAG: stage III sporulation protein AF [Clostridia bacterium]|nr:stage III sporulation protein AF [Clostridia bacterium]
MTNLISSWILSIAGVITLSVLTELILPEGQMNKYVKTIFSFIIVLTIIIPIPKLLKTENIKLSFYTSDVQLQEDFLYQNNINKISKLEKLIIDSLEKKGYEKITISINANIFESPYIVEGVYVDLSSLVINKNQEHKDIIEVKVEIKKVVQAYVSISEELIVFNE